MHSGRALRAVCPSVEVVEHFFVTALSPRDAVSAGDGSQEDSGTASSIRMRYASARTQYRRRWWGRERGDRGHRIDDTRAEIHGPGEDSAYRITKA